MINLKVGQRIRIRDLADEEEYYALGGRNLGINDDMLSYAGRIAKIARVCISNVKLDIDEEEWSWHRAWLEPLDRPTVKEFLND